MYSKCRSSEADGGTSLFRFCDPLVNGSHYTTIASNEPGTEIYRFLEITSHKFGVFFQGE